MRIPPFVSLCLLAAMLGSEADAWAHGPSKEGANGCEDTFAQRLAHQAGFTTLDASGGHLVIARDCKAWPGQGSRAIAAFAYDGRIASQKQLAIAVLEGAGRELVASYAGNIPEDSASEVGSSSLTLDTARYQLAKDMRAFGVRLNTFRDRCTYEGGSTDALTLYVVEGRTIRPVFSADMWHWQFGPGNRCGGESEVERIDVKVRVSVAPSASNGFADLRLTAVRSDMKVPLVSRIVRYDGDRYDLRPWHVALEAAVAAGNKERSWP